MEESWKHKRRRHRVVLLNKVEDEIERLRDSRTRETDVSLWLSGKSYRKWFSSKGTWEAIRVKHQLCHWSKVVWFKYATPKYAFILWLAMKGRLATGDRMIHWNGSTNTSCVLCTEPLETVEHLFFECSYSTQIWGALMKGLLRDKFTVSWEGLMRIMSDTRRRKMHLFLIKYMFQATVYMIWRERNRSRHGEAEAPAWLLIKLLDKNMRNRLTLVQMGGDKEI